MFYLKICNDFSKRYLESFGVLIGGCWVFNVRCWWCEFWVVGCLMLGVDEMIRWLIKIIYNMSWYFICFLLFLS